MPNIPCIDELRGCDCIGDSPFKNLSAEAPDVPTFQSTYYGREIPPLGLAYLRINCAGVCFSETSQEAADLCAAEAAQTCITTTWREDGGPGGPAVPPPANTLGTNGWRRYLNEEQTATTFCPDGLPFTYTVPAGLFGAAGPVSGLLALAAVRQANAEALSYALRQAELRRICLSNITGPICLNVGASLTITAFGNSLARAGQSNLWELVSGDIPPGMTIETGFIASASILLTGTPTAAGTYLFSIAITTPNGSTMVKPYTLNVMAITNGGALPGATAFTPYSYNVTAVGVTNPIFVLESGSLPLGMALDAGGIIFGTPIQNESTFFTLSVTEAGTGVTCNRACSLVVTGIPPFDCMTAAQNIQDIVWTTIFPNPPTACSFGVLAAGVCTGWRIQQGGPCPQQSPFWNIVWQGVLCNPGPAYAATMTVPWTASGVVGVSPPHQFGVSVEVVGHSINSSPIGDLFTLLPNPLVVNFTVPATTIMTLVIQLLANTGTPIFPPGNTVESAGNLTLTPLLHP